MPTQWWADIWFAGPPVVVSVPVAGGGSGQSPASICSLAFIELGLQPIQSMDDQSPRGSAVRLLYPALVDEVTKDHSWKFSLTRATLAKLPTPPLFEYSAQFQLPAMPYCLKVWETSLGPNAKWREEGRLLLCNADTIDVVYGARITDPSLFDPGFISALKYKLASELAPHFKPALGDAMRKLFEIELLRAKGSDSQQQGARTGRSTSLSDVRR